ncbi:MAG: CBS domain-containing protein [Phycisphaerales bacterium]
MRMMPSLVRDIMTRSVVTVNADATIDHMRRLFEEQGFHHLLVRESHRVVGVVSDRDLLRHLSPWAGTMGESKSDAATLRKRAHQIMSRGLVSVRSEQTVLEAIRAMLGASVSCLPVLDEHGRPDGIVTWRDILRWTADQLELEARDAA